MGWFEKLRAAFARFMSGRHGVDQLSYTMVIVALVMTVVAMIFGWGWLTLMSDALLVLAFFRMLSKNRYKRAQENADYLQATQKARVAASQWVNRVKNGKKYRYFTCPKCKNRLRVPRGVGNVTITCKNCGTKFDKKA